jgi:PKD repeat protein
MKKKLLTHFSSLNYVRLGYLLFVTLLTSNLFAQQPCEANFILTLNQTTKTVVLTNTSLGPGLIYNWSFGDGTSATTINALKTYIGNGPYTICLNVTKADSSCKSKRCSTIVFTSPCTSSWTVSTAANNNLSKNFTSTNTSLDYNYFWTFGDGTSSDSRTPNHIYSQAGKYRVCLRVSKKDSTCVTETCDSITVTGNNTSSNCLSTWSFTTSTDNTLRKIFTSTNTSLDYNYLWTFGDNTTSDSRTPNHLYAQAGKYKVCLRVTKKDSSCTNMSCDSIVVSGGVVNPCNANWSLTTDSVNSLKKYFKSAIITNTLSYNYLWTFGDGTSSDSRIPTHVYSQAGKFRVCLKVTKKDSSCSLTVCDSIKVSAATGCEANFTYNKTGREVHFTNTSSGAFNRSYWVFGDTTTSNLFSPNHNYTRNDSFNVCLFVFRVVGNDTLCSSVRCKKIGVANLATNPCSANFTFGVNHNLRKMELTNTSVGSNLIYNWSFGDSTFSTAQNPVPHYFLHNGVYRVCLTVRSSIDSNCRGEKCVYVTVNKIDSNIILSQISANFTFNVLNNANNTFQFVNNSGGSNLTYNWDFGDGEFSTDENPVHSFEKNDYYLVCLAITKNGVTDVICNSVSADVVPVSVAKTESFQVASVYPNPFDNTIKVALNSKIKSFVTYRLLDISGKLIEVKQIGVNSGNNEFEIETSSLGNGIYILNIVGDGLSKNIKLIK